MGWLSSHLRLLCSIVVNRVTPIKKNRWVFSSLLGHYSDNTKCLSELLHELDDSAEIIWMVKEEYSHDLPDYVKVVPHGSKEAEKCLISAKIIIDNGYTNRASEAYGSDFRIRLQRILWRIRCEKRGQKIYSTWHGTPLKRIGRAQIGSTASDFVCCDMTMLVGNQFTADKMRHLTFDRVPMKVLGSPRNDLLFTAGTSDLREKLGIPADKKVILFAPTFRNDGKDIFDINIHRSGINQLKAIDFQKLFEALKDKFGGSWIMICRFHPGAQRLVDWDALSRQYGGSVINGNAHDDMAEYLACADVLLTDTSSCMFDFILTERPCFLYFPDLEYYANVERGFYLPIEELPFPLAVEFDDLLENIRTFDNDKYIDGISKLQKDMGYREDGNATTRILEWIFEDAGLNTGTPGKRNNKPAGKM